MSLLLEIKAERLIDGDKLLRSGLAKERCLSLKRQQAQAEQQEENTKNSVIHAEFTSLCRGEGRQPLNDSTEDADGFMP